MTDCRSSYECEDECSRITDFCRLVHSLVQEINGLEEEIIRWRQALIKYLPPQESEGLRSDIFSNLAGDYSADEAYQFYIGWLCNGQDPMGIDEHVDRMLRLRDGTDDTTITL
jgi:hypothetical protein